jgi:hypothetical protein
MSTEASIALEYLRRLYANVLEWYKSAETKAQLILTLDGVFLSFLTGSILSDPSKVRGIVDSFGPETWLFLTLMSASLSASMVSALFCLFPRVFRPASLTEIYDHFGVDPEKASTYDPHVLWFFQMIAGLNQAQFEQRLRGIDAELETTALASQIYILSGNVINEHRWVDRGFAFTAGSLILFLATGIGYIFRVARF